MEAQELNKEPKLKLDSRIITFDNRRNKNRDLIAIYAEGVITKVYTLVFHTLHHKYQYRIKLDDGKIIYRYYKDIFNSKEDCLKEIERINHNREIVRKARKDLI